MPAKGNIRLVRCLQGAIDLVQMDLEEKDPAADLQRLREYCRTFRPPRKLDPLLLAKETDKSVPPDLACRWTTAPFGPS